MTDNKTEKCIVCHEEMNDHIQLLEHFAKAHTRKTIVAASMLQHSSHMKGAKA